MKKADFKMVKEQGDRFGVSEEIEVGKYFCELDLQEAREETEYYKRRAEHYEREARFWCGAFLCLIVAILAFSVVGTIFSLIF